VNLAARISDVAPDGHVYVPASLVADLPADAFQIQSVDAAQLQGIGLVDLVDVSAGARTPSP